MRSVVDEVKDSVREMAEYIDKLEKAKIEEMAGRERVNNPEHYQSTKGIDVIQVMEAFTEDLKGAEAVYTSNVLKYICRWKKKNGIEDLKKAEWYLQRLIRHMELVEAKEKIGGE